ncbi:succinate dehydrogenase subunit 5, mitochondrial-like [Lolium rigidum]|uniref:succinate dehydrogenase subunit 5, mitochondrial-like n=1 Tax=Lolium rigidum TaxID=89674 RepID=UPI001F5E0535|nr:succinate dehydrogenase subunit 5, mitochondrial-like [Lolium rigidum]
MAAALRSSSAAAVRRTLHISQAALSTLPSASRPAAVAPFSRSIPIISGANSAFSWNFRRLLSSNEKHLPALSDPDIESALKDLMAASWNQLPHSLVEEAKKAVSKATDDVAGQEALRNVFCAAEACEEFSGVLVTLRMALDDLCGLTGENVGPLPGYVEDAVKSTYGRYMKYLESFGPDEHYLRKKVETELGTKMIHLKMRCSGIGSEWGKVTLIGTSGISGSYVELRA